MLACRGRGDFERERRRGILLDGWEETVTRLAPCLNFLGCVLREFVQSTGAEEELVAWSDAASGGTQALREARSSSVHHLGV